MLDFILQNKPVLVGLHLGFAILGIDFLLWLLGELVANAKNQRRMRWVAWGAVISFAFSWLIGGYYYVKFYGSIVKPVILGSVAPWAHQVVMESKEHIFLFILPLSVTILLLTMLTGQEFNDAGLKRAVKKLTAITALLALLIGLMGFVISAAARWA
ncbi:MAG: hypothetical protein A3B10_03685 [Candidatus Doudnabacteria bacterium RIFCSPLOWO2_01_FULL_44_21]|uniref:DUF2231 domain-containing protein n=1 Tax=Candidatus Doudnabacteria bacterium RIFCSPLOWO2_01_FULL_44_21 TaxID=1817841 RepID=A0A1F5PY66_9BACT|nr:MAG: hypothetical protein A3B95_02160 [Candidatus Doudnabacteria bacterium RIFCSPHIGHO2_02_FULL_43_13b]OGE94865.1 MAG: hypothetical protein A3B10_03685 [Candidatus Doudnabacteria bacterium RIFCSPLOWO2_01_FULL_44_21]